MSVTIRARLPKSDTNGLTQLESLLAEDPDLLVYVVAVLQADIIEDRPHDADNRRHVKTVVLHVEATDGKDAATLAKILRARYSKRTGKAELPLYGEEDDEGDDQ